MGRADASVHDSVASRRQALNDHAYKAVLQTLFARNQTDSKAIVLMQKLRKELNISTEQHRTWLQQLQGVKAEDRAGRAPAADSPAVRGGAKPGKASAPGQRGAQGQQAATQRATPQRPRAVKGSQQPAAQQAQQPQAAEDEKRMVGYKVQYFMQSAGWREGVITDFRPPNIIITFNLGTPQQTEEVVRWEQSNNLHILQEVVDLRAWAKG